MQFFATKIPSSSGMCFDFQQLRDTILLHSTKHITETDNFCVPQTLKNRCGSSKAFLECIYIIFYCDLKLYHVTIAHMRYESQKKKSLPILNHNLTTTHTVTPPKMVVIY
jgi:hypothetical protein